MKRRTRTTTHKSRRKTGSGQLTWKFYTVATACVILLLGSLLFAARNQFASITFGFKNAELRKNLEDLQAEKRRLTLDKEKAISPAEISRAAQKLGFTQMTANNIEAVQTRPEVAKNTKPGAAPATMVASLKDSAPAKKVAKTGLVTPSADSQRSRN